MKKKIITLICILILTNAMPAAFAIPTQLPANTITTEEEALHEKSTNLFMRFIVSIINILSGKNTQNQITSRNVSEFSSTVKSYQALEEKENPDYADSKTKEKVEFGTGILDIIAGILSFFKM